MKFSISRLFTFIVILVSLVFNTYAQSSTYYEDLVSKSGMKFSKILSEYTYSEIEKNNNFLFITSESNKQLLTEIIFKEKNKKIIVICNSNFKIDNLFSCTNKESIILNKSSNEVILSLYVSETDEELKIPVISYGDNEIFVFHSNILLEKNKQDIFVSLLKSYEKSKKEDLKYQDASLIKTDIKEVLLNSFSFELITYFSLILITLAFFYNILTYLRFNFKNLAVGNLLEEIISSMLGFYNKNIYLKIIFFIIAVYFIIFITVFNGFLDLTKLENLIFTPSDLNTKKIFSIFFYTFLLLFILISRVDFIKESKHNFIKKFNQVIFLNKRFLDTFFIFLLFILSLVISLSSKFYIFELRIVLLLFTVFITVLIYKKNIDLFCNLKNNHKYIISFFSFLILFLNYFLADYTFPIKYKYENLINVDEPIVILPYFKDVSQNNLVRDFTPNTDSPIFVNELMVYNPKYVEIQNIPILNFKAEGNNFGYYVTSKNLEDLFKFLLNRDFDSFSFSKSGFSNNFYILSNKSKTIDPVKLEIKVICSHVSNKSINLVIYSLNEFNSIVKNNIILGSFLECNSREKIYDFILPYNTIVGERHVFQFYGFNNQGIVDFKITNTVENLNLSHKPFSILGDEYKTIQIGESSSNIAKNFFASKSIEEFTFKNNLSENINKLLIEQRIPFIFLIWSPENITFIKNKFINPNLDAE